MFDILKALKVHHSLSLDTTGCPYQLLILWVIMGNFKFEAYFEFIYSLWVFDSLRT